MAIKTDTYKTNQISTEGSNEILPKKPSGIINRIRKIIKSFNLFNDNNTHEVSKNDKSISSKGFSRRTIIGNVISSPREIKEKKLTSSYTIAPSDNAVNSIKKKMNSDDKAQDYVEVILQSILEAEDLAHALYERQDDYKNDGNKIKIRTYKTDGSVAADITYNVKKVDTPAGLNAFILEPQDTPAGITPEIKMIFVGTKDLPGVVRDAENGAAGNESFELHQDALLNSLNEAVKKHNQTVKINIIGHSLGGADAQRMVLKITKVVAHPKISDPTYAMLTQATGLQDSLPEADCSALRSKNIILGLGISAAPALEERQVEDFANDLKLATRNIDNTFEFRPTVSIYSLDFVPTCGEKNIISDSRVLDLCTQANVVYIKSKPFQHESEIFKNSEETEATQLRILQTNSNDEGEDKPTVQEKMKKILNRSTGIDRLGFIKKIKEAFVQFAIKQNLVVGLYPNKEKPAQLPT